MKSGLVLACAFIACVFLPSCGDNCKDRVGHYVARYTEVSGDCHFYPEEINLYFEGNESDDVIITEGECAGGMRTSDDNCVEYIDVTCPSISRRGTTTFKGKAEWSVDGTSGSGMMEYTQWNEDGSMDCSSYYEITYTKVEIP